MDEVFFLGMAPSRNYNPNAFVTNKALQNRECYVCRKSIPAGGIVYDTSNEVYRCKVNCTPWYGEYNTIHYSLIEDLSEPKILDSVTRKGDIVYQCNYTYKGKVDEKLFSPHEIVTIAKRLNKPWANDYVNAEGGDTHYDHSRTIEEYVQNWKSYFDRGTFLECRQKTLYTGFGIPNSWPYLVKQKLFNDLVIEFEVSYDELVYKICPVESIRLYGSVFTPEVLPCYNYYAKTKDGEIIRWNGKLKDLKASNVISIGKGSYSFIVDGVEYTSQIEEAEDH